MRQPQKAVRNEVGEDNNCCFVHVFAILLFLLLPIETSKYRLSIEEKESFNKVIAILHADLNGDRSTEMVRCKKDNPVPAIVVHMEDGEVIDQWSLNGKWVERSGIHITDYDNDGFKEIVGFTFFNDSIWLHVIEPLQAGGTFLHIPVDRVELYKNAQDWSVNFADPADLDGDNRDDFALASWLDSPFNPGLFLFTIYLTKN